MSKIKIDKIEKSDTYNGDTVFKIEGSKRNSNGTIDVEYGYTNDDKLRIKCYNLTIDDDSSVTGEEIQKEFPVIGRWGEKHVRWCTEYETNYKGFATARDAKKAMIQFIIEWSKVEETVEQPVEETVEQPVEETVEETVEQPVETKIIVVTYESGTTVWFPFNLENMENIVSEQHNIFDMQIVKRDRMNQGTESNKMILVIYGSGITTYFSHTLENMEHVISDYLLIEHIEIIERA